MSTSFPFTTLEEFLFWEDRPAYPWSCFARFRFDGQLDRGAFETAVGRVLQRHPLLRAKARMRGRNHVDWVVEDDPQPILQWEAGPVGGPFPHATHLDLLHEIGIRFRIVTEGPKCDLVVQWHHACCDGAGIFALVDELLIAYALAIGTTSKGLQLRPIDPDKLNRRGRFGLTARKLVRMLPKQVVGLLGVRQFLMRSPVPIVPHEPCHAGGPPPGYPAVLTQALSIAETGALRKTATQRGVRLNDLMATQLFLSLDEWRFRHDVRDDGWLRMMVPINLRTASDRRLSAACLASSVFLDRRRQDCEKPQALLRSIHDEMDLILSHQLGLTFIFTSWLFNLIPGELRRRTRAAQCSMSCIFTNLGKMFAHSPLPRQAGRLTAGNVTLESIDAVAPNRPCTCAAFAASIYAGRLAITLHHDPRAIASDQAANLLETFLGRLRNA
ncbi:MAG TPA: hypothetical protein VLI39_21195 [Sedimentisphaerales bacterium]|nr:hypothetical protein [Sedimentisphaerales bacterium]